MNTPFNGRFRRKKLNAHLSYRGKSVIVDYEHCLHDYSPIPEGIVPFEVYPYSGDVAIGCAKLDSDFHKVDLEDLIKELDKLLEDETEV